MIGTKVLHYAILEKLGEGGMGIVYKAQDTNLERLVALKFMPHHVVPDEAEEARFLQEAKAASALNHPNVCTIYGIEQFEGNRFIAMEYIDGTTLRQKMPIASLADAIRYGIQIGDALHEAHTKGIVHRDIKSDNIMVNARDQVKVMDFGLAKLKGSLRITKATSTVGTLAYMAPEQIQGGEVDARSDIFSYGVLLYEMVTGRLPYRSEHEAALMYSIINEEPDPIEKYRADLPPVLVNLIVRALEKSPNDRYQSINEMVIELVVPPVVGRVGAYEAWLAGWRDSSQVPADIAGGQACRSQCSDLQMREILADSTANTKDFRDWRVHSGGPIVIGKLTMNLRRQRKYGLGQCHFGQQSFSSPLLNCRCPLHFG